MDNMIKTYNVIDMAMFYDMLHDEMFLVLSDDKQTSGRVKRIKVWARHFLDLEYGNQETVCVLVKNKDTRVFDVVEIPERNGICDVCGTLFDKGIQLVWARYAAWSELKRYYYEYTDRIIISDKAVVKGQNDKFNSYRLSLYEPVIVGGTKMYFHNATIGKPACLPKINLVNKCLCGQEITDSDFFMLIDDGVCCRDAYFDFGTVRFWMYQDKAVRVEKILATEGYKSEDIAFYFNLERITFPSMFLKFVLQAESDKQLLKRIDEYYVGGQ